MNILEQMRAESQKKEILLIMIFMKVLLILKKE